MKEAFVTVILFTGACILGYSMYPYINQATVPRELVPEVGEGKTFVVGTNTVRWITDPTSIQEAFNKANETEQAPSGMLRTGLAVYNTKDCTIYAYEPTDVNDRERMYVLGHELLHCFRGDYHK